MSMGQSSEISALIGDFFHAHARNNIELLEEALNEMQRMIYQEQADIAPFRDYFNNIYSDRNPYNTSLAISDYPKESILRELLQNAFGCYFPTEEMRVVVEFEKDDVIKLTYNEDGFTLEQLLYYLSIGRSDGDRSREGRFGVGSKSVFMNVQWFTLHSANFSFRMTNEDGTLLLRELDLRAPLHQGTEIRFGVDHSEIEAIKENLLTLTEKKGKYINLVELCFAFVRKKMPGRYDEKEVASRTIELIAVENGQMLAAYKVARVENKTSQNDPLIHFSHNGKGVIDFIWHEAVGYVYLIPYAVSNARRAGIAKVILDKYNYFSTYELTGLLNSSGEQFLNQKLSAFFISIPNSLITSHRTGIKHECEEELTQAISGDLRDMCDRYSRYFVLDIAKRNNSDKFYLRPKHFVFEFFANFIHTSPMASQLGDKFQSNISLCPPGMEPITYDKMCEIGYFSDERNVPYEMHESGDAAKKYIEERMQMLLQETEQFDDGITAASYEWRDEEGTKKGREFSYIFRFGDQSWRVDSEKNPAIKDYGLNVGFRSVVSIKLDDYVKNGYFSDDDSLVGAMTMFDDVFGKAYSISMKYNQLNVTARNSDFTFDVSKMTVNHLKRSHDFVVAHADRFENERVYNDILRLLINSFTQGKDAMTFLREMKNDGADIGLQRDINGKYRFAAYGMQFMIPSKVTCKDLMEIVGDAYLLISCGMFNGRLFDFTVSKAGFSFEKSKIVELLGTEDGVAERFDSIVPRLHVSDLKIPRIALIDDQDKIIRVLDQNSIPTEEEDAAAAKIVVLMDGIPKPEFSHYLEFLLTGMDDNRLGRYYSTTEEPNRVLLDQIPYYYKPQPSLNSQEIKLLKDLYNRVRSIENESIYRNYFAKDINGKLFGYGGTCQCCPRESEIINNRVVKEFEVSIFMDETEKRFKFALYLCSDDAAASSGWIFEDISIGGMNPFLWLEEVNQVDYIPPEFMLCNVRYRSQLTYDIAGYEDVHGQVSDSSTESELQSINVVLSPLMIAKWIVDNTVPGATRKQMQADAQAAAADGQAAPIYGDGMMPMMAEEPHEIKVVDLDAEEF
ncbi:MAG: hypothetical protein J1E39_04905 [Eubacterium sp.]|nr:hypothetical protein [Eubacterium sp.]